MAENSHIVTATAIKYFKKTRDVTTRNRLLLDLLRKKGLISYNWDSTECRWNVQVRRPQTITHGSGAEIIYSQTDMTTQLSHGWRGAIVTNLEHAKDRLMNRGESAIFEYYKKLIPQMRISVENQLSAWMFGDGSTDPNLLHGFKTFLKFTTPTAADRVAVPQTTTYGGKNINLGALGGTWSANSGVGNYLNATLARDWPIGSGSDDYDALSPLGVNDSSTAWGTDSADFEDNAWRCFEHAIDWQVHRCGGEKARPTVILCSQDKFSKYKVNQEARFRNVIPHEEAADLGFPSTLKQNGVMIYADYDVPAGEWYGIPLNSNNEMYNNMELRCLTESLVDVKGPEYDMKSDNYLFKLGFWGNFCFQPKFFIFGKSFA